MQSLKNKKDTSRAKSRKDVPKKGRDSTPVGLTKSEEKRNQKETAVKRKANK